MTQVFTADSDTREFLNILHRNGKERFFQSYAADGEKESYWRKVKNDIVLPGVAETGTALFFGVHPVITRVTPADREKYSTCTDEKISHFVGPKNGTIEAINCLYSEFDGKDETQPTADQIEAIYSELRSDPEKAKAKDAALHNEATGKAKSALYATNPTKYKALALARVNALTPAPSVIVFSGGGYQCYWLLSETLTIRTDLEDCTAHVQSYAADLQERWVAFTGGDPGVHDLRRILRLPGTYNRKPKYGPNYPLVEFVKKDFELFYSLEQLAKILPTPIDKPVTIERRYNTNGNGESPIDRFNTENRIEDVLEAQGYTRAGKDRMSRPGEPDSGGVLIDTIGNRSQHWSTNDELYSTYWHRPFSVICKLDYNGDLKTAVREIAKMQKMNSIQTVIHVNGNGYHAPDAITVAEVDTLTTTEQPQESSEDTEQAEETPVHNESYPYDIENGRMSEWRTRTVKGQPEEYLVPLADFWARISGENTDEYGERTFVISGEGVRGGRFSFEIPALHFGDGGKLVAALESAVGAFDPIHVGQGKHMGAAIKKLTSGELSRTLVYTRTGWANDKFLIPGKEPENTQIRLARKLPFAFRYNADLAQGLQAFESLLAFMGAEVGPVVMASLLLPPLANLAGWRNERYATFIKGRSGTHKTSTLQTAMCIYGADFARDEYLLKFGEGATRGAIMACATQAGDLPLPLDNYKPSTGGGAHDFTNLIHNILEGGEKERLDRSARLKETKPIFTWPVCTGEDLPSDDPASLARILVVTFDARNRGDINHLSTAQELSNQLCAVGAAWIEWLESDQGRSIVTEIGQSMAGKRNERAQELIKHYPKMINHYRIATNIVINQLAWAIVCEHPSIGPIAQRYLQGHQRGIGLVAKSMAGYTASSLEANRFVQSLKELLAGGRLILLEKGHKVSEDARNVDHVVGWSDGDGGGHFLPELTIELVKRYSGDDFGGITRNALYEQLDQLGFLASKDKDQNTKSIKVQGCKTRVLHLSAAVLTVADDGSESS